MNPLTLKQGLVVAATLTALAAPRPARAHTIAWREYGPDVFAEARREGRLVLLDLGAVWCHWCHVMDEVTYEDPAVIGLVRAHFLAIRVDQDARPDLAARYDEYGWPATILYDSEGREIAKLSGFIPPRRFEALLRAFVVDPSPGPSVRDATPAAVDDPRGEEEAAGEGPHLSPALRAACEARAERAWDEAAAGWGRGNKFLRPAATELLLLQAQRGSREAERRVRRVLDASLVLVDPVWGGVYQYSDSGRWDHPHFEKIMAHQADALRVYARASQQLSEPRYLAAAWAVAGYLRDFLRAPDGGFYTSQDADRVPGEHAGSYFALDDRGRRELGLPAIDTHQYARECGWAIQGLAVLAQVSGAEEPRALAEAAARWALRERGLPGGGFRHDAHDAAGPYLADTLAMAEGLVALHEATGAAEWLQAARDALAFMDQRFVDGERAGVRSAAATDAVRLPLENAQLARAARRVATLSGDPHAQHLALLAGRFVASPAVAPRSFGHLALLLDAELPAGPGAPGRLEASPGAPRP